MDGPFVVWPVRAVLEVTNTAPPASSYEENAAFHSFTQSGR